MKYTITRRYTSWSHAAYGHEPAPGVICKQTLALDGYESSHIGRGWHAAEQTFRWTTQCATAFLHRIRGLDTLEIELSSGPAHLGPIQVTIEAAGKKRTKKLHTDTWRRITLRLPPLQAEQRILPISISVEHVRPATQLDGDDTRELGVAVRSLQLTGTAQTIDLPLNSVCNIEHWKHPLWCKYLASLSCRTPYFLIVPENKSRKIWEYVHGLTGLARLGCLTPSAHALGVAAGHEPPIYWLASRVSRVYATDLYRGWFANTEAAPDVLHDPDKYAPYPYPRDRVRFFPMSGTDICFKDETIDFIFSFCSIEHFGSREQSRRSLQEMARVLRPGGIAVISTEVLLNDVPSQPEMFSPWEIYEELVAPSGLLMIGDIAPANLAEFCAIPVDMYDPVMMAAPPQQLVLRDHDALCTSVMFFLQKV